MTREQLAEEQRRPGTFTIYDPANARQIIGAHGWTTIAAAQAGMRRRLRQLAISSPTTTAIVLTTGGSVRLWHDAAGRLESTYVPTLSAAS